METGRVPLGGRAGCHSPEGTDAGAPQEAASRDRPLHLSPFVPLSDG